MKMFHRILIGACIILITFGIKLGSDGYLNAMQLMFGITAILSIIIIATDGILFLLLPKVFIALQILGWSSAVVVYLVLHSSEGNATASCIMMLIGAHAGISIFKKL